MATFNIAITVPDNQAASVLAAMQDMYEKHQGETNLQYIQRVVQLILKDAAKEAMTRQAMKSAALAVVDPPITVS